MTWKRYVSFCATCGGTGPRSSYKGQKYHNRCLPEEERRRLRFEARFCSLAHKQLIDIAHEEGII